MSEFANEVLDWIAGLSCNQVNQAMIVIGLMIALLGLVASNKFHPRYQAGMVRNAIVTVLSLIVAFGLSLASILIFIEFTVLEHRTADGAVLCCLVDPNHGDFALLAGPIALLGFQVYMYFASKVNTL